jgi:hypothetical protein
MKVIIDGAIYDSELVPIVIAWDNDQERKASAGHIKHMTDLLPADDRPRFYGSYPNNVDGQAVMLQAARIYEKYTGKTVHMHF